MSLQDYSKEELKEMAMIDIAFELMKEKKEAISFKDLLHEVVKLLELSEQQVKEKIAQFYTDLNIDGRFLGLGDNRWGLRVWYPIDQLEEEVVTVIKPKKKKKKKVEDDDLDEFDEDEADFDDYDEDEEEDLLDDEDELAEDDDLLEEDEELLEDEEEFDLDDEEEELDELELEDEDEEDEEDEDL